MSTRHHTTRVPQLNRRGAVYVVPTPRQHDMSTLELTFWVLGLAAFFLAFVCVLALCVSAGHGVPVR